MSERKRLGELGQIAFEYRATKLGLIVSRPYGDNNRYDCVVDNGHRLMRVQVKTTNSLRRGAYEIHAGRRRAGRPKGSPALIPYLKSEIDYMVGYIEPEESFYLIPITALGERTDLLIFPETHTGQGAVWVYREAWHLLLAKKESKLPWGQASRHSIDPKRPPASAKRSRSRRAG